MSTTRNTEAVANQEAGGGSGEFKPRIERDEPMMKGGHQPGKLVGNDAVPEFQAHTVPPGTAPAANTFQPNNTPDIPPAQSEQLTAEDTIGGATSGDVHTGLGHPGSGQTSRELRHDGEAGRKNPGKSLEGVGASTQEFKTVDASDPDMKHLRALDKDEAEIGRGNVGGPAAQERVPVSAEQVAGEMPDTLASWIIVRMRFA